MEFTKIKKNNVDNFLCFFFPEMLTSAKRKAKKKAMSANSRVKGQANSVRIFYI